MSGLLIAGRLTPTNISLHEACGRLGLGSRLLPPGVAVDRVHPEETVLGRIDVQPSLAGPESGLAALRELEAGDLLVLNRAAPLLRAHDKLQTACVLAAAGVAHPLTAHVLPGEAFEPAFGPPYVVKPRFGSWGKDVVRCDSERALRRVLSDLERRSWFREQGALVQELVANEGIDLRIVVAGETVVGAVSRIAAAHEWRTNIALGGRRKRVTPSLDVQALALAAARAIDIDLVGVDLLPTPTGHVVLELNGCVDFTPQYSLGSGNVFEDAVVGLMYPGVAQLAQIASRADPSAAELQPVG